MHLRQLKGMQLNQVICEKNTVCQKGVSFMSKMVCKSLRGWTSEPPLIKLCWVHPLILKPHRSAEASLCRREAGEREKESPGEDGKGERADSYPVAI